MNPISIIVFLFVVVIFLLQIRKYRQEVPAANPISKKEVKQMMKETKENPEGTKQMVEKIKEKFQNEVVEDFTDVKDIRYGQLGSSNHSNGLTINKWIKIAGFTLNGAWSGRGFTLEVYPRMYGSGGSRQTIVCLVRNEANDITNPYIFFETHNNTNSDARFIKDVNIVRTSGSGITNNKIEVWIQIGTYWADKMYVMWYLWNFQPEDFIAVQPQPQQDAIPAGQSWGITDVKEPNTFRNDLQMTASNNKDITSIRMNRNDESNRYHEWKFWHMNEQYGKNDLQIWEYAADDKGAMCGGNFDTGARCQSRMTIKGTQGFVGINTTNPRSQLEVNGDLRVTGKIQVGNTILKPEGNSLFIDTEGGKRIMRIDTEKDKIQIYQNSDGKAPYFYYNNVGDFYTWSPQGAPNPNMRHGDKMTIRSTNGMTRLQRSENERYGEGGRGNFANKNRGAWEQMIVEKCGYGGVGDNQNCV